MADGTLECEEKRDILYLLLMRCFQAPVDSRTTHDDRSLKDAIQASLEDFNADELEVFPVEKTVREGGRYV